MKVKSESEVVQACPALSDPMDCSLTGSSIHGIFQAGVLKWGAIAFSGPRVRINPWRLRLWHPLRFLWTQSFLPLYLKILKIMSSFSQLDATQRPKEGGMGSMK